jgi:hypothetical protein
MRKRISIDQLKVGMKVERLDRSWLATLFLRHRFTITSAEEIEQLHASGVQQIDVDVHDDRPESGSLVPPMPVRTDVSLPIPPTPEIEPSAVPFAEELPVARQVYKVAKLIIQQAMDDVRMGRALNIEAVSEVVGRMADSILRNPDALMCLARLKQFIQVGGVYSVGSGVLLNTGEAAILKQFNHHVPLEPLVVLVTDEAGRHRSTPLDLDLAAQFRQSKKKIASILDPINVGITPSLYLDKEAT